MHTDHHRLKPSLGFWALFVYGVGDILGAGIYALVGKIAGIAGAASWIAFLIAIAAALLTALSYAELVNRFPHSGGASYFCQQAFQRPEPAILVGWLVFCSGVASMATLSHAFAGYFGELLPQVSPAVLVVLFLAAVSLVNFLGIELSSLANITCTAIETGGLLIIIAAGLFFLSGGHAPVAPPAAPLQPIAWIAVLQAGALAFYACIGFEDLVNVAEEAREPRRDVPRALLAALLVAGALYLIVAAICVAVVAPERLAESPAPLLLVLQQAAPAVPLELFAVIPLFAVANSALLNGIMASRLLFGMSRERLLPWWLARVHAGRRTPHVAIIVVLAVAAVLALSGTLVYLAGTASVLLLGVFAMVHLALLAVKLREPAPESGFRIPMIIPAVGIFLSLGLMAFAPGASLIPGAVMLALGLLIVALHAVTSR